MLSEERILFTKATLPINVFQSHVRYDRNLLHCKKKSGGGVLIAINTDFTSEEIVTFRHKEFENIWAKALINGEMHILSSVYFSPQHANKHSSEL